MFSNFITFHGNIYFSPSYNSIYMKKRRIRKNKFLNWKKKYKEGKKIEGKEGKESKGRDDIEDQDSGRTACWS